MAKTGRDRALRYPIGRVFCLLAGLQLLWTFLSFQGVERRAQPLCSSSGSCKTNSGSLELPETSEMTSASWKELSQPRVLSTSEDSQMIRSMKEPWWICSGFCKYTVYYVPTGTLAEQLNVIAFLLKLSRDKGFALKYVHDPDAGPAAWDQVFEEPRMDIEIFSRKGSQDVDRIQVNNPIISTQYGIDGVPDGSEQLNFPLGQVDCDLRTDLDWDHDITWKRIGTSGRYVLCVKALNVVAEGLQEANKSNVKWFFRALKPARSIRKYIVDFRNYYQWLSYTWTGIQIGTQLSEDNPHGSSPIEGYTRQMHKLFMSIPNHDLEEWQLVRPMRFFLVTSDQQARDKVLDTFHPGVIVHQGMALPDSPFLPSQHARDVVDLYLLASCKAVVGDPKSITSRIAVLIGENLYLEPAVVVQ